MSAQAARLPSWKRADLSDRVGNHLFAEAIYEREIADGILQVIERVKVRGFETQDVRPTYRLVEVRNGNARVVFLDDLLKDVRRRADRRAS